MEPMTTTSNRKPLTQASIVATAITVADEGGVSSLSMRKLAARLGYEVMSLYNHVANKNELLGLMVDAVAAEIDDPPDDAEPLAAVRAMSVASHRTLVTHPWAPQLWLRHLPGPARVRQMDQLLRALADSGLSPELAHHGYHAVTNHVLGYTMQELEMDVAFIQKGDIETIATELLADISTEDHPHFVAHVQEHLDGESSSSFELVLDLIIDGLVRLDSEA